MVIRIFSQISNEELDYIVRITFPLAFGRPSLTHKMEIDNSGCIDGFSRRIMFLKCSPNN